MPAADMIATAGLRDRIAALGPWSTIWSWPVITTAPEHFLGDYPSIKWRGFAHALPPELHGRTVLDIGCNCRFLLFRNEGAGAPIGCGIDFPIPAT